MRLEPTFVIICVARALRTFGFGSMSVVLGMFLIHSGFTTLEVGALFSASLIEDALVTAAVCSATSRFSPKSILLFFSLLLTLGALVLGFVSAKWLVAAACIIGVISPSGFEGGPFSAVEQAVISHAVPTKNLIRAYSWYNLIGFGGAALGALGAGVWAAAAGEHAFQGLFLLFACAGLGLVALYAMIPHSKAPAAMAAESTTAPVSVSASRKRDIYKLAALQSLDSFGGGFVAQALISYWFHLRFGVGAQFLGPVFFITNVFAAVSFLIAPLIAKRIGLLRTMVFTHLPCSLTLALVPFMPSATLAAAILIARSLFSSMDVPVRQAFLMLLVPKEERTAAAGITNGARALAQGVSPTFTGWFQTTAAAAGLSFVCAGVLKSIYDISLYFAFRNIELSEPEEEAHGDVERREPATESAD